MRPGASDDSGADPAAASAAELVAVLSHAGRSIAAAESLTGGLVVAALVGVPGASSCVRGGLVAYASDVKAGLLGVPAELLAREGAVHPEVARAMARGARLLLGADYGVATTGVAGPDPQDGVAPGTFHVAVAGPFGDDALSVTGGPVGRDLVRRVATGAALVLALRLIRADGTGTGSGTGLLSTS